ncbi:glycosyltransferase family protein [Belliella pelovolcani]|nr:hypothetical protein [Belliella pelovolcani]
MTIEALQKNKLAERSDLIIYSDGNKNELNYNEVLEVRNYLKTIDGFKSIEIIEREKNLGLASNIIDGVTINIKKFGKVIVLEDDIVTSPFFLTFMNSALDYYNKNHKVWHISGWNYPMSSEGLNDVYFWRGMICWGWATWADKWEYFEKDPIKLKKEFSAKQKYVFDLEGSGIFWPQIVKNLKGKLNTWAIFWYASIFKNNGLCLHPTVSYVENVGFDGSGTNCVDSGNVHNFELNTKNSLNFDEPIFESEIAVKRIKLYYKSIKKTIFLKIVNKSKKILKKYMIIRSIANE